MVRFSRSTYNTSPSVNKDNANEIYAELIKEYGLVNGEHCFLESRNMLTALKLNSIGVQKQNMHVANHDEFECRMISNFVPNIHHMDVNEYLFLTKRKFKSFWLDYCGTALGNQKTGCNPIEDLQTILAKGLIHDGGIVGFTFSTRRRNTKDGRKKQNRRLRHKISLCELKSNRRYTKLNLETKSVNRKPKIIDYNKAEAIGFVYNSFQNFSDRYDFRFLKYLNYRKENKRAIMYTFFIQVYEKPP